MILARRTVKGALPILLVLAGCSGFEENDAGPRDAGALDATSADATAPDGGEPAGPRSLVILYTNDEHSGFLGHGPERDDFPVAATSGGVKGGLLRRAAILQALEEEARRPPLSSPVVLVGSGGRMSGSVFQLANLGLGMDLAVASVLGYDVLGLGPSDLELGASTLATTLATGGVSPMFDPGVVSIPVVSSNIRFSMTVPDDDGLADLYLPYGGRGRPLRRLHVERFGDVTVGFVGVMGLEAALSATFKFPLRFSLATDPFQPCDLDAQCPGSVCLPPAADPTSLTGQCALDVDEANFDRHGVAWVADVAAAVAEARRRGAELVVALTSGGVDDREIAQLEQMGFGPERASRSEDIALSKGVDQILGASGIDGIDVIVGGFSGSVLTRPIELTNQETGRTTFIVQAGTDGEWAGALRLVSAGAGEPWRVDEANTRLVPIDAEIDTSTATFSSVTKVILESAIETTIENLEGLPAAIEDGIVFPGEQCDGEAFPNQRLCAPIVPGAVAGRLACTENRQLDMTGCELAVASCDGRGADPGEMCDGADLAGATCDSLGYDGGALGCLANCTFDVSRCERDFPSILEILFRLLSAATGLPRVKDDPAVVGDVYFFPIAETAFDLPRERASNESNLLNLLGDAERWSMNAKIPRLAEDPVRLTIVTSGIVRQGLAQGETGVVSLADLFRVLPLGVSPQERSPGFVMTDFWVTPGELRQALELGVGPGLDRDRYWLAVSGARVDYDLSRPAFDPERPDETGRIVRITLARTSTAVPWADGPETLEDEPIFELGTAPDPSALVHTGASLALALQLEGLGVCPRDAEGRPAEECRTCGSVADCPVATTFCDLERGRCTGQPGVFNFRTLFPFQASRAGGFLNPEHFEPFWAEELKDLYTLLIYLDSLPGGRIPDSYAGPVPRRMCCTGAACPTDRRCD